MTVSYTGMNPQEIGAITDQDHLWNSVRDVLMTPLGTRVMRRDYGSLIPALLDEPKNEVTRLRCMSAVAIALAQWEPRIALNTVSVTWENGGAATIELGGVITTTMQQAGISLSVGT